MENIILVGVALVGLLYTMNTQGKKQAEEESPGYWEWLGPFLKVGETNQSKVVNMSLDNLYKETGRMYGVEWELLKALAIVESSERPQAKNPADPSYGLMQILCVPDGKGGCSNKFNIDGWPPNNSEQLYDAEYNVKLGAQIIKWNIDTYGFRKGIAVYNNWSARNDSEPFSNQSYLEKVLREYNIIKGAGAA